jgi:osmotically-inducible protein OsmY
MHFITSFAVLLLAAGPAFADSPDGLITARSKLLLWTSLGVRTGELHVDTDDGVIALFGSVNSLQQHDLAERLVRSVTGVRGVRNQLEVVRAAPGKRPQPTDRDLMARIDQHLRNEPTLTNSRMQVRSVEAGAVVLSGTASSLSDHLRAVSMVGRMPGVRAIASDVQGPEWFGHSERLDVSSPDGGGARRSGDSAEDMRLSNAVKLRLLTARGLPVGTLNVDCDDGVIFLFGSVGSKEARAAAVGAAGRVEGVVRVESALVLAPAAASTGNRSDAELARDVTQVLSQRAEFLNVTAQVTDGVVVLTGSVDSPWNELAVVRAARLVPEVVGAIDRVEVELGTR